MVVLGWALVVLAAPAQAGVTHPMSHISTPAHRGIYADVDSIEAAPAGVSAIHGLQVALKMKMVNGKCKNFNGERFVVRDCSKPRWLNASTNGLNWSYELPEGFLLRPSDPHANIKHYVAFARTVDALGGFETIFETGRNVNRFDVVGGP